MTDLIKWLKRLLLHKKTFVWFIRPPGNWAQISGSIVNINLAEKAHFLFEDNRDPPTARAADIIMIFFMMYCPSIVGSRILPCWKVISGSKIRGRKVPPICRKSSPIAILEVDLKRKVIPMMTSHHPITETHWSVLRKGIQFTVALTRGIAADKPSGFKIPNQTKITANEILIATV